MGKDTFTIKVYNAAGEALSDYTVEKAIDGKALEIAFPHYTEYDSYGGYVRLLFDFSDKTKQHSQKGKSLTVNGTVQPHGDAITLTEAPTW